MTGSPATRPEFQAAPPTKRANSDGIPVRLHDGPLIAHISQELADAIVTAGDAQAFRRGPRRYVRLRQGISVPRPEGGWEIIEYLRRWHGDKRAAGYIGHMDRQSERLRYQPPTPILERTPSIPTPARPPTSTRCDRVSYSEALRDGGNGL